MNNFLLEVAAADMGGASMMPMLISMGLIFAVMYFLMIRPQRKKEKATQDMRSKLEVGDEIVTIGGIVGLVVSIKDDTLVIETGSDRSRIRVMRWSVQTNHTIHDNTPVEK